MKILVTGFDAFGGEPINPSTQVLNQLPQYIGKAQIITLTLPTIFYESAIVLKQAIENYQPNIVICLGQAGGLSHIAIERVGINLDDARIADNAQQQPIDQMIQSNGATAYFSNLPIKAIYQNLQQQGIPVTISNSAGTFVCNHILYQLLYLINTEYPNIKGGFIHIPYLPSQVIHQPKLPSMSLSLMVEAIEHIITTAINFFEKTDIHIAAGQGFSD